MLLLLNAFHSFIHFSFHSFILFISFISVIHHSFILHCHCLFDWLIDWFIYSFIHESIIHSLILSFINYWLINFLLLVCLIVFISNADESSPNHLLHPRIWRMKMNSTLTRTSSRCSNIAMVTVSVPPSPVCWDPGYRVTGSVAGTPWTRSGSPSPSAIFRIRRQIRSVNPRQRSNTRQCEKTVALSS